MRVLFLLLMAAMLLTACGQKGPLYFPEPSSAPTNTPDSAL